MGPRPIGRGMDDYDDYDAWVRAGFNGAAADRPRNVVRPDEGQRFKVASMGPRPIGRGMDTLDDEHVADLGASMGPRPIGRGMTVDGLEVVGYRLASMGPRPIGRGMKRMPDLWD